MAIDTLAYTKTLERAGVDRQVAEAHAEAMLHHVFPQLATKQDITELKLWLVVTVIGVAGISLAIAKAF